MHLKFLNVLTSVLLLEIECKLLLQSFSKLLSKFNEINYLYSSQIIWK